MLFWSSQSLCRRHPTRHILHILSHSSFSYSITWCDWVTPTFSSSSCQREFTLLGLPDSYTYPPISHFRLCKILPLPLIHISSSLITSQPLGQPASYILVISPSFDVLDFKIASPIATSIVQSNRESMIITLIIFCGNSPTVTCSAILPWIGKGEESIKSPDGDCGTRWKFNQIREAACLPTNESYEFERNALFNKMRENKREIKSCSKSSIFSTCSNSLDKRIVCAKCTARFGMHYEFCWTFLWE